MFIVHYENGKSISEAETIWDDLPKEGITSVQLKWDAYDFIKVLKERIDQFSLLIDSGQQFKAILEKEIADYIADINIVTASRKYIANMVIDKANSILTVLENKIKTDKSEWLKLKQLSKDFGLNSDDVKRFNHLLDMLRRQEQNRTLLFNVVGDMRAFLDSDVKIASLSGSSKHKYAFWQDKIAYYNINSAKDLGPFSQRIGMIIDSTGKTIVCEMNLRTGNYKIYLTTVNSLKLDLNLFKIDLSEVS